MPLEIHVHVHEDADPRTLEAIQALALHVASLGDMFMALSAAVQAKIDQISAQLDTAVAGIQKDIDDLKAKITAPGGATDAEVLAGLDKIGKSAQKVTDLDLANPGTGLPPDQV